ncbi:MAG TPA: His/Gly/Thr/Pro-type tRNA ligase C-terminal domain-containing protein, partial [Candidatus Paceibacterota bacterium]|nr:His/Gly/Thr/Pro-type tRNA ligase C-terminal domain-containing protein [Candidatus Paceibacterota bacterium]
EKFADADLMGMPYRIVVSDKTLAAGGYEVKHRATGKTEQLAEKELIARLKN